MVSLLLAVIYLAFISLGLPDALLGSAWPVMQGALNAPFPLPERSPWLFPAERFSPACCPTA